jgi:ubiquinol-cytochrome c reductase cytochrome c subunit
MARTSPRRSTGRRSPWAAAALIGIGLLITGGVYAGASAAMAATTEAPVATALTVEDGKRLFQANCATCHGLDLQGTDDGPSLYGVGELAVEFQVATGRMPMAMQGPQAPQKPVQFSQEQIDAMAAYVQTTAPGPTFPDEEVLDGKGDVALPDQLCDVPQRRRRRRRPHRGQVRAGAH